MSTSVIEQEQRAAQILNEMIASTEEEIGKLKAKIAEKKKRIKQYKKSLKDLNGKHDNQQA